MAASSPAPPRIAAGLRCPCGGILDRVARTRRVSECIHRWRTCEACGREVVTVERSIGRGVEATPTPQLFEEPDEPSGRVREPNPKGPMPFADGVAPVKRRRCYHADCDGPLDLFGIVRRFAGIVLVGRRCRVCGGTTYS